MGCIATGQKEYLWNSAEATPGIRIAIASLSIFFQHWNFQRMILYNCTVYNIHSHFALSSEVRTNTIRSTHVSKNRCQKKYSQLRQVLVVENGRESQRKKQEQHFKHRIQNHTRMWRCSYRHIHMLYTEHRLRTFRTEERLSWNCLHSVLSVWWSKKPPKVGKKEVEITATPQWNRFHWDSI